MTTNLVVRLLLRVLLLLVVLVVADQIVGAALERLFYRQKHGDDVVSTYTIDKTTEPVLVFGSSRASHHYVTAELDAMLHLPVYNCGRDEMNFTYTAAMLREIYRRYTPQCVIIEVLPIELANRDITGNQQRVSTVLLPYARRHPALYETIGYSGWPEVLKSRVSHIYPYNSLVGSAVQNTYTHLGHSTDRGYEPLYRQIDSATYTKSYWGSFREYAAVDAAQAKRFSAMLDTIQSRGTRVFLAISPFYFPQDTDDLPSFEALKRISAAHGVPLMDWSADPRFLKNPRLFNDDLHLNDSGARLYTKIVAGSLAGTGLLQR